MSDAVALLRRHEQMKQKRQDSVESVWRDCFDLSFPLRGDGLSGAVRSAIGAQAKQAEMLDSTAADSINVLASNIMGSLTPANSLWFALDVGNETDEERRWLDESADLLWENIHMANFDAEAFEGCLDICSAGQFALYVDEDHERGGFAFELWPLASVYVGSTRANGGIDIVHREYPLSAEAAAKAFGRDNLPERVRKQLDTKPDEESTYVHAIYPRQTYAVGAKLAKNMPIASCHIELQSKQVVRESGYHEMPVITPRWSRVPGSAYAVGPMYNALPDVRQINHLKRTELDAAELAVSGMWLGIDDGVLNPRTVKVGPRKVVVAAEKDSFTALQTGANFELSDLMVSRLQGSIRKTLMADQLPPADGPAKTAYEYSVRVDLIRKLLGPIYGRLQAEYLKPLIDRCFGIAFRAGIFAPAPESLRGRNFAVRYVSPMARAQKIDEVQAIQQVFASAGQMAAAGMPELLDELDGSEALKRTVEGLGAPESILRPPQEVAARRAARDAKAKNDAMQAGMMNAQHAGMEEAAKQAAVA